MSVASFGAPKSFHDRVARVSARSGRAGKGRAARTARAPMRRAQAVVALTFLCSTMAALASVGMP